MISIRVERVVFLIVLMMLAVVFSSVTTEIVLNHVPYNEGLSPEQVIEKELHVSVNGTSSEYRYKIISNTLFAVVDSGVDSGVLHIGYKNNVSGFSFYDHASNINSYQRVLFKEDPNGHLLWVQVGHIVDDYSISIIDHSQIYRENSSLIIIDQNGTELEKIESPRVGVYWIDAFEQIPEDYQLVAESGNNSTVILDKEEILNLFGGQ